MYISDPHWGNKNILRDGLRVLLCPKSIAENTDDGGQGPQGAVRFLASSDCWVKDRFFLFFCFFSGLLRSG